VIVNGTSDPRYIAATGDVTFNSSGVTTLTDEKVLTTKIKDLAVTDAKLASPNNSIRRTLLSAYGFLDSTLGNGNYALLSSGGKPVISGAETLAAGVLPPLLWMEPANFAVAGRTLQNNLLCMLVTNGVEPSLSGMAIRPRIWKVAFPEAGIKLKMVLSSPGGGTPTPTFSEPLKNQELHKDESAAATGMPASGLYTLGFELASGPMKENSSAFLSMHWRMWHS